MTNKRERQFPWNKKSEEKIKRFIKYLVINSFEKDGLYCPKSWSKILREYKIRPTIGSRIPNAMVELHYVRIECNRMKWDGESWNVDKDAPKIYAKAKEMYKMQRSVSSRPESSEVPQEKDSLNSFSLEHIINELNMRGCEVTIKKSLII